VSNDNPYSEAAFKTVKYHPTFPQRFGSIQDARAFCETFFTWYNHEHHHSGVGLHTPAAVHYGHAAAVSVARQQVLDTAWINKPEPEPEPDQPEPLAQAA
jgi:putative transposase